MDVIIAFFVWVMCAITAAVIAGGKQRSAFGWFLLGLLFSVFAVVMVACLPRLPRAEPLPVVEPRELSPAEKQRRRQDDVIGTAAALVIGGIGILVFITLIVVTS